MSFQTSMQVSVPFAKGLVTDAFGDRLSDVFGKRIKVTENPYLTPVSTTLDCGPCELRMLDIGDVDTTLFDLAEEYDLRLVALWRTEGHGDEEVWFTHHAPTPMLTTKLALRHLQRYALSHVTSGWHPSESAEIAARIEAGQVVLSDLEQIYREFKKSHPTISLDGPVPVNHVFDDIREQAGNLTAQKSA